MELMWSLANTLQLIMLCATLKLYYSSDLVSIFKLMRYSNFDNPVTDSIVEMLDTYFGSFKDTIFSQFENIGYSSTNILVNSIDKLLGGLVIVTIALALMIKTK